MSKKAEKKEAEKLNLTDFRAITVEALLWTGYFLRKAKAEKRAIWLNSLAEKIALFDGG